MIKYLTRVKKEKPDLPDVFPASQGKLKIEKPKMTLEKQKASSSPLREDYLGQLADKRKVRTSSLNDAVEVRNVIIKNKGHISNMEELAKKAGIFVEGKSKQVDHRKVRLALDLALDSLPVLDPSP